MYVQAKNFHITIYENVSDKLDTIDIDTAKKDCMLTCEVM